MHARRPTLRTRSFVPDAAALGLPVMDTANVVRALVPGATQVFGHEQLRQNLQRMMAYKPRQLALICIDLDSFQRINDSHGQDVGDRLLALVAERLRRNLRDTDLLARLDGDRFAIASPLPEGRPPPHLLGDRLRALFGTPFEVDGQHLDLDASLGIAIHPGSGATPEQLLHDASLAMHQAKAEGGNALRFFRSELRRRTQPVYREVSRLRRAIERGHLEVHYQLQFELHEAHRPSGLEALLRWRDGDAGLIPPDHFLPLVAEYGLMPAISRWLLRQVCRDNRTLIDAGLLDVPVAVNVCADTFLHDDFLASLHQALTETGLAGERLEVEIVESAALQDLGHAARTIDELKRLGVKVAMDDFGTGYSSPALLKSLPFDRIKIDRSFVATLPDSPVDQAIVQGILNMANSVGVQVVAEGIEHAAQLDYLRQLGCAFGQGFWYARPMPLAELRKRLAKGACRSPADAQDGSKTVLSAHF